MHIARPGDLERLRRLLRSHPVVGILGPRQVGKTTLARDLVKRGALKATVLDLEDPADVARLGDARLALEPLRGVVVIDEIQRRPDLFPLLRVLADRPRHPARFLVLGSASPELLRQSSESPGAELDLLVVRGRRRWGFEFKRTSAPVVTRSMRVALEDLRLERLDVVHGGPHSFQLAPRIRAVAFPRLLDDLAPLA